MLEKPRPKQRPDPEPLQKKPAPVLPSKPHKSKAKESAPDHQTERGYYGVLTRNGVPRKIIPSLEKTPIRLVASPEEIKRWKISESPKLGEPYFVFEENESELLIGPIQDKELALGWVSRTDVHHWDTRIVVLDDSGAVRGYVNQHGNKIINAKTGEIKEFDEKAKRATFFSETELDAALVRVTRLLAIFESKKMPHRDLVKVLRQFIRDNNADFLDLTVPKNILDELPVKRDLNFLERRKMDRYIELIAMSLGPQLDSFISLSDKAINDDDAVIIVPETK